MWWRRVRGRGLVRAVAGGVLGGALTVGFLPPAAVAAPTSLSQAAAAVPTSAESSSPDARSETEAIEQAKKTGESVEVTSLRGQSSEVFATPDGKLEAREYLRPVRARVDGQWRPIDADLATTGDGMVAPKVATVQLEFSGGGDEPMVRLEKAGRKLELTWPGGDLPQPQLNGATATYPEVLPGVDLRLTAQADGFAQLLVVKTAEAAKSSALAELRLGLNTAGISVKETVQGGLTAVDEGAKTPVFEASKPLMWDSSGGSATETTAKQTDTERFPTSV